MYRGVCAQNGGASGHGYLGHKGISDDLGKLEVSFAEHLVDHVYQEFLCFILERLTAMDHVRITINTSHDTLLLHVRAVIAGLVARF